MPQFEVPDPSSPVLSARVAGEHADRYQLLADGTEKVGDGTSAPVVVAASGLPGGWYDVTSSTYGALGDGTGNDATAITAAITAANAAGGGIVYMPPGTYRVTAPIEPLSNVTLRGAGVGRTILKPVGEINCIKPPSQFTAGAPLTDAVFEEFEIDGSLQTVGTYSPSTVKGIFIQHLLRCHFRDLYIHDTGATGLGCDHFQEGSTIQRVTAKACGRLNGGAAQGGNGIGIGLRGATDESPITIAECHAINNVRYGIFVETQAGTASTQSSGVRIVGCYASGNQVGIADSGGRRTAIVGNTCTANSVAGIAVDGGTLTTTSPGYEGLIEANVCYLNGSDGIRLEYKNASSVNGKYNVVGNVCGFNTGRGIAVNLTAVTSVAQLVIAGNVIHDNARSGIRVYFISGSGVSMTQSAIIDNHVSNNGTASAAGDKDGIRIECACTDVVVERNRCYDRLGTQKQDYGFITTAAATFTGGAFRDNDLRNNKTGAASIGSAFSATTAVGGNRGYTPAAPAAVTPGASPWTYTAPDFPSTLSIYSGTVSSITVGGTQVAAATNVVLPLESGDSVVVTYSVAPTVVSRAR